jgi:hypothetical protein
MAFDIEMIKKCMKTIVVLIKAREIVGHPLYFDWEDLQYLWDGMPSKTFLRELIMLIFSR